METDTYVSCEARTIRIRLENSLLLAGEISTELAVEEKTYKLGDASLCFYIYKTYAIVAELVLFTLNEDRSITHTNTSVNIKTTAELRTVRSYEVSNVKTSREVNVECITFKTGTAHTIAAKTTLDTPDIIEIVNEVKTCVPRNNVSLGKCRISWVNIEVVETALYAELPLGEIVTLFRIVSIGLLVEVLIAASCNSIVVSSSCLLYRSFCLGDDDYGVVTLSKDSRNSAQAER